MEEFFSFFTDLISIFDSFPSFIVNGLQIISVIGIVALFIKIFK